MRKVERSEIVDFETYGETRAAFRAEIMAEKAPRRIHVGDYLTFLFETTNTVRYQIQEIMRAERIVKEADIVHEIETYNTLIAGPGELVCTLLIEIDSKDDRDRLLRQWVDLPRHLFMLLDDGRRVTPVFDAAQISDEKLSAVQYLRFEVGKSRPVALGSNLPDLTVQTELSDEQKGALAADLSAE